MVKNVGAGLDLPNLNMVGGDAHIDPLKKKGNEIKK